MSGSFLERVLIRLVDAKAEFLVVGGVSAVLQGAPVLTQDLDVCYRRTRENIERVASALDSFAISLRTPQGLVPVRFDAQFLWNGCNFTLSADGEDLDLLGEMSGVGRYEDVVDHAPTIELGALHFRVLSLADLVATKRAAGRPKDLAVLPLLEELLKAKGNTASG